jgi:hypothetical protein
MPLDRVRLTAAKSSLGCQRKLRLARPQGSAPVSASEDGLRLARPQGSDSTTTWKTMNSTSPDPRARTQPRLHKKTDSASPDPRARTQPRLRKTMDSASPDPRARTQPRLRRTMDSASPDPRARTQPRPRRSLRLARPRARTRHVTRKAIITLPLASSGYGEQDRRPIRLASVNM